MPLAFSQALACVPCYAARAFTSLRARHTESAAQYYLLLLPLRVAQELSKGPILERLEAGALLHVCPPIKARHDTTTDRQQGLSAP